MKTILRKCQQKIVEDTLKMPDAMANVMGDMTKKQVRRLVGKTFNPIRIRKGGG